MLDKQLFEYIKDKKKNILIIVVFNILGLLFSVSITALLITSIYNFIKINIDYGIYALLGVIICVLFKAFTVRMSSNASNELADYVVFKLRNDTYSKFLRLRGNRPFTTSEMAQLSTEGIEQLRLYYSVYIPSFFYSMIAPMILFIIFMFIKPLVAMLYLVCVPLIPVSIIMVSKWAKRIFNKYWDQYISLGDSFLDNTKGMKELKIFLYDEARQEEMMAESESFRKITMKVLTMQLASVTIMDLIAFGGAAIGIVLSLIAMQNGLDIYLTLFMILIGAEFFLPMRALGSSFHVAMNGATAGKKVIKLLDQLEEKDGRIKIDSINSVTLKDLSFGYDEKLILNNINITLTKGFHSIVGVSGSGKSTIAKICINNLKPTKGQVLIDGKELSQISLESFYKKACYISNNTYIFNRSIKESFLFYNKNLTIDEMYELLSLVKLNHFTDLDFVINDTMSNLSGGEKQRLVLAFYLASDYDFYIFDEATSNIDIESEEIILNIIKKLSKDKIVLFISHRLKSVIGNSDIYYLKDSVILEHGTSDELLNTDSEFKRLYEYQLFLEGGDCNEA